MLVLTARLTALPADSRPTLTVVVQDRSSAAGGELGTARTRANYVFDAAGIRIAWTTPDGALDLVNVSDPVQLVVLDGPADDDVRVRIPPILGFAVPAANRVYVYYDRVQALALERRVQPGWFLGVVIAHELAHVLLPDARHASSGLMAATLGADPKMLPAFTGQEARLMRERLTGEMTLARVRPR